MFLNQNFEFQLQEYILKVFQSLKDGIKDATLTAIDQNKDFQVETSHERSVKGNVIIMPWRREQ